MGTRDEQMRFRDRIEAGQKLGEKLHMLGLTDAVILALPRGGVTVAGEVSRILGAPLDVVIARKIGAPGHSEYGIGALSEDGVPHFNPEILSYFDIRGPEVRAVVKAETEEMKRRIERYRSGRPLPDFAGKTVVVIDDGLATGVTAAAAGAFLRTRCPGRLLFAAPVCPEDISPMVSEKFDDIICLGRPRNFQAVGLWYANFDQVEDDEVMAILNRHHQRNRSQGETWKPHL